MGRMLGSFDYDSDSERSDLNLCPDCKCYFPQDACPLCGKICPEEMRAGNRKPVKSKKTRHRGGSGRVTFVEWYHTWIVIVLALIFFPIAGIILLITSPHKRSLKIGLIVVAVLYSILSSYGFIIVGRIANLWEKPVDTSLTREEYVAACEEVDAETYYRSVNAYEGKFVSMTLVVTQKAVDADDYGSDYTVYYLCKSENGGEFTIMIRDCVQDLPQNLLPGDVITVYGEGAGEKMLYDSLTYYSYTAPCIHVAYLE
jgi:hypothetical protein